MATCLFSFGFRHGNPVMEPGARVIDVRRAFNRNPFHNKTLRSLRGDHPDVAADILKTPSFEKHYAELLRKVNKYPGAVYLGCTGGHHRSVFLADRLGRDLRLKVTHLNYNDD